MKNIARLILIVFTLVVLPLTAYFVMESSGATIDTAANKVAYDLPYPGILPDHPLYFVKIIRDRITEFVSRDTIKKAEVYLLFSDKRVSMSMSLAEKGKNKQAIETFSKAEKYFIKIPPLLKTAKKQGSAAPSSFVETLKLSNSKHRELINELLKTLPAGLNESLNEVLNINNEIKSDLESL